MFRVFEINDYNNNNNNKQPNGCGTAPGNLVPFIVLMHILLVKNIPGQRL